MNSKCFHRYCFLFALAAFLVCALPAFGAETEPTVVRVGVYENSPKIYRDEAGVISGLWADLVNYIAEQEDWEVHYIHGNWAEGLERLENNEIDIMVDVALSEERKKVYDFSQETVLVNWAEIYTREGVTVNNIFELEGKDIAVMKSGIHFIGPLGIRNLLDSFGIEANFVDVQVYGDVFEKLDKGEADAGVVNRIFGISNAHKYKVSRTGIVFNAIELRFALSKDASINPYLVWVIDKHMKATKEDPGSVYHKSIERHLEGVVEEVEVFPEWGRWLLIITGILVVFVVVGSVLMIYWRKILKRKIQERTAELEKEVVERKKAEKELAKEREHLEEKVKRRTKEIEEAKNRSEVLLASIGDGVFAIDKESKIIHFNRRAEEISGYKASEVLGKPYYDSLKFLKEKDRSENVEFIRTALKGEVTEMVDYTVLVRKDKREVPVADSAAPIKNEKGEVLGAIVVFRDTVKERQIERMKAEMISLVGHQLKAPLTAIKWRAEMLKESKLDIEEKAHVEEVERVAEAMTGLVADVLDISKIEQGRIELKPEAVRFEEIVDSILKDLSPLAKERKVDIEFIKPEKPLFQVNVDPKYMKEAIQNIISNAIKYTKDKVTISCEEVDNRLRFSCVDNGIGIPQREQSQIFTKFYRANNVVETKTEGTGLGLSITKAIVEKSGGELWFTSKEGEGTTFYVSLPFLT